MLDRTAPEALPFVDPTLRPVPRDVSARVAKWRFTALVAVCLLLHAAILAFLLWRGMSDVELLDNEEVPVEVVDHMPDAPEPTPPPEPEQKPPPKDEEKPLEYEHTIKPAYDAPRAPNEEKVEREAPQKETQAPEQSNPPAEAPAEKAAQPDTQKLADVPAPERQEQTSPDKLDDDKPDAEALKKAEAQLKADKQKANADAAKTKKPLPTDQKAAMAKQLAALAPTPDYTLGAKSKPAIVSGGTENTTYLSVLYGLIMKKVTNMNAVRSSPGTSVIFFALDETGHIVHIALEKGSGFPDIDQQTMDAVRRASPFPPPPRDIPHRFFFSRDIERGH